MGSEPEEKLEQTSPDTESQATQNDDVNALESSTDALADTQPVKAAEAPKQGFGKKIQGLIMHINIYILAFIFIVVLAGGLVLVGVQRNKKVDTPSTINTTKLSEEELQKISESEQKVGDPKSTLSIESNAIFNGKVLIRDSLDVAGTIKVGGALSLPGISVSGNSTFDQITTNNLTITGNTSIQGQLSVQRGITSSGGATFGGPVSAPQLTVQSLQLSGDLQITRHIDASGGTPRKTDGSALGPGGTASISGSDTAGTINVNVAAGAGAGCYVSVSFAQRFNGTPHVVVSPVGQAAAEVNYYITNRTNSGFSLCATAVRTGSFAFDYIVIE